MPLRRGVLKLKSLLELTSRLVTGRNGYHLVSADASTRLH